MSTRRRVTAKSSGEALSIGTRTLQEWEQGRRFPSGVAQAFIRIARRHPAVLRAALARARRVKFIKRSRKAQVEVGSMPKMQDDEFDTLSACDKGRLKSVAIKAELEKRLDNVLLAMKKFAANPLDDAAFWQPAPLLARLAAQGKSFT